MTATTDQAERHNGLVTAIARALETEVALDDPIAAAEELADIVETELAPELAAVDAAAAAATMPIELNDDQYDRRRAMKDTGQAILEGRCPGPEDDPRLRTADPADDPPTP